MFCPICQKSKKHKVMTTLSRNTCTVRPCICEGCGAVFKTIEVAMVETPENRELFRKFVAPVRMRKNAVQTA